jgi:hypothetical protein
MSLRSLLTLLIFVLFQTIKSHQNYHFSSSQRSLTLDSSKNIRTRAIIRRICSSPICRHHILASPSDSRRRLHNLLTSSKTEIIVSSYGDSVMEGAQDFQGYLRGQRIGYYGFGRRFVDYLSQMYYDRGKTFLYQPHALGGQALDYMLMCVVSPAENADIILVESARDEDPGIYSEMLIRYLLNLPQQPVVIIVGYLGPQAMLQRDRSNRRTPLALEVLAKHYSLPGLYLYTGVLQSGCDGNQISLREVRQQCHLPLLPSPLPPLVGRDLFSSRSPSSLSLLQGHTSKRY